MKRQGNGEKREYEGGLMFFVKTTPMNYVKNVLGSSLLASLISYLASLRGGENGINPLHFIVIFVILFRIGELILTRKVLLPIIVGHVTKSKKWLQVDFVLLVIMLIIFLEGIFIEGW
jgi:uncharacterized protein (DUF2062 family)